MSYASPALPEHGPVWNTLTILGNRIRTGGTTSTPASTAWPANNDAYLIPFVVSTPVTFVRAFFHAGTSPGTATFDLGIYTEAFALIRSLGATAAVNTTDAMLPVGGGAFATPVTLTRGRYYLAMSAAATTITVRANVGANQQTRTFGMVKMASAHPLPTTFVPASMSTTAFIPLVGLMTAASVVS